MKDLSLNIYIISRITHNYYAREFRKFHLTMGQFPFMLGIAETDGISQEGLSARLRISKSTTAAIIQQLLAKGCIERQTDPADRRNFQLHLTEKGRLLIPEIRKVIRTCHAAMLTDLTPQERSSFLKKLEHVCKRTEQKLTEKRK